ncbi:MFS transporter [Acidisphaera sp. S103]|uniref:MFS transporter n=1 Tax=Acidisphaera sp. S103 TaxID=1747223 RepID=UPI00131C316D|nr:MFS transporter [Acidisphaera sp. S103]
MTRRRYWVYFLLFVFNVICYLDRINMSVAGRSIAQDFGLSPVQLGYLFSSFLWAYVVMMLPSGRLVDGLGAHRLAAIGAAFWSVAQMLTGATTGFVTMIIARLGLGAGEAPTFPVSYRAVRDWAPYTERGLAVGLIQAGTLFGPALSAPVVAWLIAETSWRWSFLITGAVGLLWVAVWIALVSTPEKTRWIPEPERRRILAERHEGEPARSGGGVGYRGLLRSPSMWGLAISQGCAVYSVYLYLSWLPNYLQTVRGLSIVNSGLFTSVPFLVGGVVIIVTNWISDRILTPQTMRNGARRNVVVVCLLLCSAGLAIPFVDSLTVVVILTIFPISFGGTATATNAALTNDLLRSQGDSGRAFAFMVLGGNVFGLLAPIVTGYIVQATGSFSSAFVLAGALSLIGAVVSFALTRYTLGEETPLAVGFARGAG